MSETTSGATGATDGEVEAQLVRPLVLVRGSDGEYWIGVGTPVDPESPLIHGGIFPPVPGFEGTAVLTTQDGSVLRALFGAEVRLTRVAADRLPEVVLTPPEG